MCVDVVGLPFRFAYWPKGDEGYDPNVGDCSGVGLRCLVEDVDLYMPSSAPPPPKVSFGPLFETRADRLNLRGSSSTIPLLLGDEGERQVADEPRLGELLRPPKVLVSPKMGARGVWTSEDQEPPATGDISASGGTLELKDVI